MFKFEWRISHLATHIYYIQQASLTNVSIQVLDYGDSSFSDASTVKYIIPIAQWGKKITETSKL